jgi:hypothetical protein
MERERSRSHARPRSSPPKSLLFIASSRTKHYDTGGRAYVVDGSSAGLVTVNCTHVRGNGKPWMSF